MNYREETKAISKLRRMVRRWQEALPSHRKYDAASRYCVDVEANLTDAELSLTPSYRRAFLLRAWKLFQYARRSAEAQR